MQGVQKIKDKNMNLSLTLIISDIDGKIEYNNGRRHSSRVNTRTSSHKYLERPVVFVMSEISIYRQSLTL